MRKTIRNMDVVVVGAGAAGMMCAAEAGKRGRSVLLVDHASRPAEKIRISGGGRCNFTNLHTGADNFLSSNPHFCRSALARYTPHDFIALLEKHNIRYHEKKNGQLFCNNSAQQIIEMLMHECNFAGVSFQSPSTVSKIEYSGCGFSGQNRHKRFVIQTERNTLVTHSLVIATGGLSLPQIGASDFGYQIARQFDIPVTPLRPGLVGLTVSSDKLPGFQNMPGVAIDSRVSWQNKISFRENLLLTHRGFSGPAILQISSYWKPSTTISIDLLPQNSLQEIFITQRHSKQQLHNLLADFLPKRFVKIWCDFVLEHLSLSHLKDAPVSQYNNTALSQITELIHNWEFAPNGTMGYKKAEVTLGGVDTQALSSSTMEVKQIPGLYFIGEVVDVTGQLGGFNFQWAWSSGHAAGQVV